MKLKKTIKFVFTSFLVSVFTISIISIASIITSKVYAKEASDVNNYLYDLDISTLSKDQDILDEALNNNSDIKELELSHNAFIFSISINEEVLPSFDKNTFSYTFNVNKDIDKANIKVTLEDNDKASYDIKGNVKLVDGDNIYIITVTAEDKVTTLTYTINIIKPYSINKVKYNHNFTYTGKEIDVNPVVYNSKGEVLVLNQDYELVYVTDRIHSGTIKFEIIGIGQYEGFEEEYLAYISTAELKIDSVSLDKKEFEYNGKEQHPNVTITYNGMTLTPEKDYYIEFTTDSTNVGIKEVSVLGTGNYTFIFRINYEIKKASNNVTISFVDGKLTVNALFGMPIIKYYKDKDGNEEISEPTENGTYYAKAIVEGTDNFEGVESDLLEFVINKDVSPDPLPMPEPTPDKKGCSCKKSSLGLSFLAAVSLFILLKKKH